MKKILFVCSQNQWRSPTAEQIYKNFPGYQARSAGTAQGARIPVTEGLIGWADVIFVMEKKHREIIEQKFPEALAGKEIICLHIPDDYCYMNTELIDLLKAALGDYIDVPN